MKIITVLPLKKTVFQEDLTYFTSLPVEPGIVVNVPLRSKKTLAIITSIEELAESKSDIKSMNFNLRKVIETKGQSMFLPEFMDAAFEASKYFGQNKNNVIASLIPNIFIEEYDHLARIYQNRIPVETKNAEIKIKSEKLLLQRPLEERISIYKTLIRESFARNKSVFVVVPTEIDMEKFSAELSRGIEQFTFSLRSNLSAKKNLETCEKVLASSHPLLLLGTARYLSTPRSDIGTIVLEHESSNTYRTINRPYLDLRTFAEIYAAQINAKFILADELLRFETIGRADMENWSPLHQLNYRVNFADKIEILERGGERERIKKFRILNEESIETLKKAVANKKNAFVFSLRKGLATMTVCRDCNHTISCERCGGPLVLYTSHQSKNRMFVCNRCEKNLGANIVCPNCSSWNLLPLGIGVDTVEDEVQKIFPKIKIFKLDKESVTTANAAKKITKEFTNTTPSILIGTEMAFFYLKDLVPLSIVASFDSLWSIPNFKMSEKVIQIILSMVSITSEKLIIETKNNKDELLQAIKSGNLAPFVREELEDRKKLDYPPFKRFIKIKYMGDKEQTREARQLLAETFQDYSPEIFSGFVERFKGKFITNTLIKIDPKKWSLPSLSLGSSLDENLWTKLSSLPPTYEVTVDPEDLL